MARTRIGILTDTHLPGELRNLWPEVWQAFAGVDLILHAGDIVHSRVLDELEQHAPVLAALGNNDFGSTDRRIAPVQWLSFDGIRIAMVHDMEPEERPVDELCRRYLRNDRPDVIVTGHTHFERLDFRDGVLQLNSGSPTHPHLWSTRLGTVAVLEIDAGAVRAEIVRLGETDGRRNPGVELRFDSAAVGRA